MFGKLLNCARYAITTPNFLVLQKLWNLYLLDENTFPIPTKTRNLDSDKFPVYSKSLVIFAS